MTTQEFSNEFDLMYDNASGNAPGINLYEKSVFLTLAQEEIVKETYSGYTQSRVGFEGSERRRRQLSELMAIDMRIKQMAMEMAIMAMLATEMAMSLPPPIFGGLGTGKWKVRS